MQAVVRGRVQGVGFRWFVQRTAREAGISGWVKNLPDGTVALEAEGTREALTLFLTALRNDAGPADVADIAQEFRPAGSPLFTDFVIKH